jgi:putative endonuclease
MKRAEKGKCGENAAAEYYQDLGIRIVERNFRRREGEIDIIAREGETVIFAEVKTRTNTSYGLPGEAITLTKKRNISRVASIYLMENGLDDVPARFDVLEVILSGDHAEVRLIQDAFEACM